MLLAHREGAAGGDDSASSAQGKAAHELTHFLREKSPARYAELKDFHKQILKPGVADINSFSGISVSYKLNRLGRKCHSITFFVTGKTAEERFTSHMAAKAQIEGRLVV